MSDKPAPDWAVIRQRFAGGESRESIALDYDVDSSTITKKAKREGWREENTLPAIPPVEGRVRDTPDIRQAIVDHIRKGLTIEDAAEICGVHRDTPRNWANQDPEYDVDLRKAMQERKQRWIDSVDKAAERGEWKAGAWLLERHPDTREAFKSETGKSGGNQVAVILHIER